MKARVMVELDSMELARMDYPVVVEMWDKKNYGRVKRAWLGEFSDAERKKASKWYRTFYRWYLVDGLPEKKLMSAETYAFLRKLVNFFGTI